MTAYQSDDKFIEHLVYEALLILRDEGSKTRGELLCALNDRGHFNNMPADLKKSIQEGRTHLGDRFGATAQVLFVDAVYLIKEGKYGWRLTREGKDALQKPYEEVLQDARSQAAEVRKCINRLFYVALHIIKENEGAKLLSELREEIAVREGENIPEKLKQQDRWGKIIWHTRLDAAADSKLVKPGYLIADGGEWNLTPSGADFVGVDGEEGVKKEEKIAPSPAAEKATDDKEQPINAQINDGTVQSSTTEEGGDIGEVDGVKGLDVQGYHSAAKKEIKEYIQNMEPREFQHLCAALLRSMGYHTPKIGPLGPDGGVDAVAYTDPLGATGRVKVQAKRHKDSNTIPVDEVRNLSGVLNEGDVGVLITSSRFRRGCEKEAESNARHIELIDFARFIKLWIEHYDKLSEEDKQRLPLRPIYFLDRE